MGREEANILMNAAAKGDKVAAAPGEHSSARLARAFHRGTGIGLGSLDSVD